MEKQIGASSKQFLEKNKLSQILKIQPILTAKINLQNLLNLRETKIKRLQSIKI